MRRIYLLTALSIAYATSFASANCDLTHYHWGCDIPMHLKPSRTAHSLVNCGSTHGYITEAQYAQLARYNRANVNMSITINDEYADGPCVPAGR